MPIPVKFKAAFFPGATYHLLFRSIDGLLLFQDSRDYLLFLSQYATYFRPILDTLSYCLLNNHSHFIVQVKERKELIEELSIIPKKYKTILMNKVLSDGTNDFLIDQMIERQVNSFMSSYVHLKNRNSDRKGGLFQSPFRRSFITDDAHLAQSVIYVHANAEKHGLVKDFKQYPHSSYQEILSGHSTNVCVKKVLDFFGGRERYIEMHKLQVDLFYKQTGTNSTLDIKI